MALLLVTNGKVSILTLTQHQSLVKTTHCPTLSSMLMVARMHQKVLKEHLVLRLLIPSQRQLQRAKVIPSLAGIPLRMVREQRWRRILQPLTRIPAPFITMLSGKSPILIFLIQLMGILIQQIQPNKLTLPLLLMEELVLLRESQEIQVALSLIPSQLKSQ